MENVIINFTSDPTGLEPGIEALDQILEADKEVAKQAEKTMDAYNKRDKSITNTNKASKKSIDDLAASVKNLDKSMVGGIGGKALDDLRKNIKLTDGQWKEFYQNLIKTAKAELVTAKTKEDIEQLNQLINGSVAALEQMGEAEEEVTKKSQSMKSRLRELKNELQQMEDAGQDNTQQFEQMAIEAGKLEDQIGDTNARIRALGSDTFVFDALISGVSGLTGAFAAAQGVQALFGEGSEEVQVALLKVNAAMSILQGLQAVQNVLQKQSAASIAVDLVLRRNQAAATTAQTLATQAQTGATVAATTAQKGLNLAFLATPTGLLLTGIAAITTAIFAFGGASKSAKDDTDELNKSLERQNELLNTLASDSFSAGIERLKLRLKGASDQKLFDFDLKEEQRKLEEIKTVQQAALSERAAFEDKNRQALEAAEKVLGKGKVRIDKETREELQKQGEIYNKKVASANDAVTKQEQKIQEFRLEQDVKLFEDAQNKKVAVAGKTAKEIRDELNKKQNEADIAAAKSAQFRTEALILQSKKGSKEELDLKLKSLDQGYFAELLVKERTVGELELLDAKYFNDRQELIKQYNQKEAQDAINSRIAQINSSIALQSINAVNENNAEILQSKKDLIDAQADLDVQSVRESETNEELRRQKVKAIYDKALADKKQLEKNKTQAEIDSLLASEISAIEREKVKNKKKAGVNPTEKEAAKLFQEELQLEQRIIDAKRVANFNLLANKSIDNAEFRRRENDLDSQQDELDIKRAQAKEDKITKIKELAFQAAANFANILFSISRNQYTEEQQQIKDLFDQKRISQEEYDNRTRILRRKQAADEKAQAVFSTLLQQGPTILQGFQKGGFAGIAAAFTLFFAMLNAVTSTAVPQFAEGQVDINGPGTGTSDSIFARISRGETVTTAAQTKKHKDVLQAIHDDKYDAHLMKYELPRLYQNMNVTATPQYSKPETTQEERLDYQRMASAFAEELANNPQAVLSFDEDGFRLSLRKGNQVTEYKNKKLTT